MTLTDMSRKDRRLWSKASTFAEYGHLTALWLEGEIASVPNCWPNTGPDDETRLLVPVLAAVNRSGYITTNSQPGCTPDQREYGGVMATQRAAVQGFATERFHQMVGAMIIPSGLTMIAFAPGESYEDVYQYAVGVSQDYGRELDWRGDPPGTYEPDELYDCTFNGYCIPPEELAHEYQDLDPLLVASLQASWQIAIFDPEWGRNDRLWPFLTEVVAQLS